MNDKIAIEKIKLLKKEFSVLEEMFCEIDSKYPYQLHKSTANKLLKKGYIEESIYREGILIVKGYELTHYGIYAYCQNCHEPTEEESSSMKD